MTEKLKFKLCDKFNNLSTTYWGGKTGQLVSVRPCGKEYENKTYIGFLIGEIALSVSVKKTEDNQYEVSPSHYNPAILIPELNKVVYGMESWWGRINKVEDLKQITDQDIENVWYVKLLKEQLSKKEENA